MSDAGVSPFLILVLLSAAIAAVAHTVVRKPFHAMVITAVIMAAVVQAYLRIQGYDWTHDKFAVIALMYPAWVGFLVSGVLAIPAVTNDRLRAHRPPTLSGPAFPRGLSGLC